MPKVQCQKCNKEFYVKPNRVVRGWGKFCSIHCRDEAQRTGANLRCTVCSKAFYRSQQEIIRSQSGKYFCSKSCQTTWRNSLFTQDKHSNWKGGEFSYRQLMIRSRVNPICAKCGITDERVLAVHHKDKNRQNNNISNLTWLCHNCHSLVHHYPEEASGYIVKTLALE